MNKNDITSIIILSLAIAGFMWAINEKTKRIAMQERLASKEGDYLVLLSHYLENKNQLPIEIKEQLIRLRAEYIGINDDVANKLQIVIELIQNKKEEIAIEKLTAIIENLLKIKYQKKHKDKKIPNLYTLLVKAKEWGWITAHQFSFSLFLKDKRNEEAHEISAKFSKNDKYIAFLAGIEIIYKLNGIKRAA